MKQKWYLKTVITLSIHLCVYLFISIDLLLPSTNVISERFEIYYNQSVEMGRRGAKVNKCILETKSGKLFYLREFNDVVYDLKPGEELEIAYGNLTPKVRSIRGKMFTQWELIEESLFLHPFYLSLYSLVLIISILSFFFKNMHLHELNVLVNAITFLISIAYLWSVFLSYYSC